MGCIDGPQSSAWKERQRAYYAGEIDDDRVRCSECTHLGTKTWNEKVRTGFVDKGDAEFRERSMHTCRKGHGSHPDILRRCFQFQPTSAVQKHLEELKQAVA